MENVEYLEMLAQEFRAALESVIENQLYNRLSIFKDFPRGCCSYTSDLLADYMVSKGIGRQRIQTVNAETNTKQYTHCWLLIDDTFIVDITADQFNNISFFEEVNPILNVYAGRFCEHSVYEFFNKSTLRCTYDTGIDAYNGDIPSKLKIVYNAVVKQIGNEG